MIAINSFGFHYLQFRVLRRCIEIQVSKWNMGNWSMDYYEINTLGMDGVE